MSDAVTELRLALRANRYSPIPVLGKEPLVVGWQTKSGASEAEITGWASRYRKLTNTGILTKNTASADVDIPLQDVADAVEDVMRDWFDGRGPLLCRFGNAPKRALLFRVSAPFPKLVAKFVAPNGSKHKIEVLCDGQQLVVDGIHPDTGRPYRWARNQSPLTTPRSELPEIDEQEARELLAYITQMLKERFGFELDTDTNSGEGGIAIAANTVAADPIEALAALSPADGASINETYCRVIPELLQRGEHPDDVLKQVVDAAMAAAEREGLAWNRAEEVKRVVATILSQYRNMSILLRDYDPATGAIPSCLPGEFHQAWLRVLAAGGRPMMHFNRAGFCIKSAQRLVSTKPNTDADTDSEPDATTEAASEAAPSDAEHISSKNDAGKKQPQARGPIRAIPFVAFDEAALPPREWLYASHYQRGQVTATIGPGGAGKSSEDLVEGLAMATARPLLGEQPTVRCRVWIHNGDDDKPEMDRRIAAVCRRYAIPMSALEGWLFVTTKSDTDIKLGAGNGTLTINRVAVDAIVATIL
jgi:hypothetical protein